MLLIVGLYLGASGLLTGLEPVFDDSANANGVIWGLLTGGLVFLVGAGLAVLGLRLVRAGSPGTASRLPGIDRISARTGVILLIAGLLGIGIFTGLLLLFAEGIRQTT